MLQLAFYAPQSVHIARISRALDQKTRTMAVELDVMNRDGALAPGMYPTVKWPVRRTACAVRAQNERGHHDRTHFRDTRSGWPGGMGRRQKGRDRRRSRGSDRESETWRQVGPPGYG